MHLASNRAVHVTVQSVGRCNRGLSSSLLSINYGYCTLMLRFSCCISINTLHVRPVALPHANELDYIGYIYSSVFNIFEESEFVYVKCPKLEL